MGDFGFDFGFVSFVVQSILNRLLSLLTLQAMSVMR